LPVIQIDAKDVRGESRWFREVFEYLFLRALGGLWHG